MKKIDLAKMLGVSRFTIRRWEKEGVLNQKIAEHQKDNELVKQNIDIENRKTVLEVVELLKQMNQKLDRLQNAPNRSQNVKYSYVKGSKDVSNSIKSVEFKSVRVAEKLQNVADYLTTTEVANALGITRRSLNDWIIEGKLKAVKIKGKNLIPRREAFKFIFKNVFDNVDIQTNAGNSVGIKDFKEALNKVIPSSNEEINNVLLELDKEGILKFQKLHDPGQLTREEKNVAIKNDIGETLFYITWVRK